MEQSLVLIKPDGVQRGLIGKIITRFEDRGLRLIGAKFLLVSDDLAKKSTTLFTKANTFMTASSTSSLPRP